MAKWHSQMLLFESITNKQTKKNKLAPYMTDGRLFATDVSAMFKVTYTETRINIKNPNKFRYCALV